MQKLLTKMLQNARRAWPLQAAPTEHGNTKTAECGPVPTGVFSWPCVLDGKAWNGWPFQGVQIRRRGLPLGGMFLMASLLLYREYNKGCWTLVY